MATKTKQKKNKSQISVENAIKVIKHATRRKLSLSEAARQKNFGRNYVSDAKARLEHNYEVRNINRDLYREFKRELKTYKSTVS